MDTSNKNINKKIPIAVVIIPTYNESENIGKMIDLLCTETFPQIKNWDMKILVVDSKSPDGTSKIVEEKMKRFNAVSLFIEDGKQGIGAAYLAGFNFAMKQLGAVVVCEFDADFQHPPQTISRMLSEIDRGYDYVLGSRKVHGGEVAYKRSFFRGIFTDVGGYLARLVLFFPHPYFWIVTDPTTGLKATRVKGFADQLNLEGSHLYSKKFGYKVQLLYETLKLGAKYKEVPLTFYDRHAGKSKFERSTPFEILWSCLKTRWPIH